MSNNQSQRNINQVRNQKTNKECHRLAQVESINFPPIIPALQIYLRASIRLPIFWFTCCVEENLEKPFYQRIQGDKTLEALTNKALPFEGISVQILEGITVQTPLR